MSETEQITLEKFGKYIHENNASNDFLVQIIELSGMMLNLKTISHYAKANGISYNGAKKFRNKTELFDTKFIIDNE